MTDDIKDKFDDEDIEIPDYDEDFLEEGSNQEEYEDLDNIEQMITQKKELEVIHEYYDTVRDKFCEENCVDTVFILGSMLLCFTLGDVSRTKEMQILSKHILDCVAKLTQMAEYDEIAVHKRVMGLLEMMLMDIKATNKEIPGSRIN